MRYRSLLSILLAFPVFSLGACSCDPSLDNGGVDVGVDLGPGGCFTDVCPSTGACLTPPEDTSTLCSYAIVGYNGSYCTEAPVFDPATCTYSCAACSVPTSLEPGFMAQYLDAVSFPVTGGERVGISGYSPGWLDSGFAFWPYGDLVYAEFTPGGNEVVTFSVIDGVAQPTDGNTWCNPQGYRGGVCCFPDLPDCDAGDDVGYYSTITANQTTGDVYIAYVDFTTRGSYKLKLAHRAPGATTFAISNIDDGALVGTGGAYFPSITLLNGTTPVVAYGVREAASAQGNQPRGWIRIATANGANPGSSSDWTFDDASMADTTANVGCVEGDGLCAAGDRCFAVGTSGRGECATPTNDCTTTCSGMFGTISVCVDTVCRNVKKGSDLVDTVGVGIDLQPVGAGLALAYHDRGAGFFTGTACDVDAHCGDTKQFCSGAIDGDPMTRDGQCQIPNGNVWGKRFDGTTWAARFLIDGYSRRDALVGDAGQHVSLAVDAAGVWHLAYLDGTFDRIRYARVPAAATTPDQFAFVDDGTPGATRPADRLDGRRRLLGGDIAITVTPGGQLRVMYQDLTGPDFNDPTMYPPGQQPVVATRAASGVTLDPWTIAYGGTGLSNAGWWITQALSTQTGSAPSWCVWADATSSRNTDDPLYSTEPYSADTHVTNCSP